MNSTIKRLVKRGDLAALRRLVAEDDARKRRVRQRAKPRLRARAETRAELLATARRIKNCLRLWYSNTCELCGASGRVKDLDLDHLLSGPLRLKQQAVDNCLLLCRHCHERRQAGEVRVLQQVLGLGRQRLSESALASIERRLARAESMNTRRGA